MVDNLPVRGQMVSRAVYLAKSPSNAAIFQQGMTLSSRVEEYSLVQSGMSIHWQTTSREMKGPICVDLAKRKSHNQKHTISVKSIGALAPSPVSMFIVQQKTCFQADPPKE